MEYLRAKLRFVKSLVLIAMVSLLAAGPLLVPRYALAAELMPRKMIMGSSLAGEINVPYDLVTNIATTGLLGSIVIEFCSNSPLDVVPCVAPTGFDASSALLTTQSGATGFVISSFSTANMVILTRPPLSENAGTPIEYVLSGITNPDSDGPLFVRVLTYPTSDGSGPHTDSGGLALMINPAILINVEVPPYIIFCVGESITNFDCSSATEAFTDLGNLSDLVTSASQNQIVIATNAINGYSMWVTGTTMTSGNNTIAAMAGVPSAQGVPQFGLNLRNNNTPNVGQDPVGPGSGGIVAGYNVPDIFRFQSGDNLVSATAPDDFRKYTVSYVVNVAGNQPGGVYATTLTYIALGNF